MVNNKSTYESIGLTISRLYNTFSTRMETWLWLCKD